MTFDPGQISVHIKRAVAQVVVLYVRDASIILP
jgi:hypothetical protein